MKFGFKRLIFALIWAVISYSYPLGPITSWAENSNRLVVAADAFPPFNDLPDVSNPGYMIEMLIQIGKERGFLVDYRLMPWARSIRAASVGEVDGIVAAGKGDAPNFVFPEIPQGLARYVLFAYGNKSLEYSGIESLRRFKLGVAAEYSYAKTLDDYIAANRNNSSVLDVSTGESATEQSIQKLVRGRVNLIASERLSFLSIVDKLGMKRSDFREIAVMPEADPLYVAFSPRGESHKWAKIISEGTKSLRDSGKLKIILEKYGVNDWETSKISN